MDGQLSYQLLQLLGHLAEEGDETRILSSFRETVNTCQNHVQLGEFVDRADVPGLEIATPRTRFGVYPFVEPGHLDPPSGWLAALRAAAAALAVRLESLAAQRRLSERERRLERDIHVATYELNARAETYRVLLDSISDAVYLWIVDDAGRLTCSEANAAAGRMLGYDNDELVGAEPTLLVKGGRHRSVGDYMARIRRDGRHVFSTVHTARNGSPVPVDVAAHLVDTPLGTAIVSAARRRHPV